MSKEKSPAYNKPGFENKEQSQKIKDGPINKEQSQKTENKLCQLSHSQI